MYAEVLIEYSAKSIDKTFTYIIPDNLKKDIKIGMKVLIPFGTKTINGFVTNITDKFDNSYELNKNKQGCRHVADLELLVNI